MQFVPTFELVGRPDKPENRLSAVALNFDTGERIWRLGFLSGEDQAPADIFAYSDGQRLIPFIYGDYLDFAEVGEARSYKLPVTSAFVTWIGNDLRAIESRAYSRSVYYDRAMFGQQKEHGYAFQSQAEYEAFCELVRAFLPPWLFLQIAGQASKSSVHAHYFPCVCVEVLMPQRPWARASSAEWRKELGHKHYVRVLSQFRGPFEEQDELLQRRKAIDPPKGLNPPPGKEERSPWGGMRVEAIERDCAAAVERGTELAESTVAEFLRSRLNSVEELCDAVAAIEEPFRLEKLLAALLNCETPPTDRYFDAMTSEMYWDKRFLWAPPSVS